MSLIVTFSHLSFWRFFSFGFDWNKCLHVSKKLVDEIINGSSAICTARCIYGIWFFFLRKESLLFFNQRIKDSNLIFWGRPLMYSRIKYSSENASIDIVSVHVILLYCISCIVYHVLFIMYCISCIVYYALFIMYCISCIVYHTYDIIDCISCIAYQHCISCVWYIMHCVSCIVYHVLHIMYCISCIAYHVLYIMYCISCVWYIMYCISCHTLCSCIA